MKFFLSLLFYVAMYILYTGIICAVFKCKRLIEGAIKVYYEQNVRCDTYRLWAKVRSGHHARTTSNFLKTSNVWYPSGKGSSSGASLSNLFLSKIPHLKKFMIWDIKITKQHVILAPAYEEDPQLGNQCVKMTNFQWAEYKSIQQKHYMY